MRIHRVLASILTSILLGAASAFAQSAYPPPPGGWTYMYSGDQLTVGDPGTGWTSLDGTWTHDNNSDAWDGSVIGDYSMVPGLGFGTKNAPGGTILGTNGAAVYLRLQDCGDPRDYDSAGEWDDPNNRKVYFGHNIGTDIDPVKAQTIMRSGVTLTFRARIPTLAKAGPPLDPLFRDGQQGGGVQPYSTNGDGYVTSDGGKGNFVIREGGNGADVPAAAIAFSFTQTTDTTGGAPTPVAGFAGLTFNEFNGNVPSANVNFGQGSKTNVVAFDPTEWHEVYIVIRDDPADIGTHEAFIFVDGNLRPVVYKITGGTGADMNDSFLAVGGSATPQNWALDVDWFGYKDDQVFPPGALLPPSLFGFAPANGAMFHPAASKFSFSSSALMPTNTLPASGFKLSLNGLEVSSQLTFTGTDTSKSRTATFSALQPNTVYAGVIIVTDSGGLSTTNDVSFDTFSESQAFVFEAEDYNYQNGQYLEDRGINWYANLPGTQGVDCYDTTLTSFGSYRLDEVDMAATPDVARASFVTGFSDYQIGTIGRGEWWNYTATLTNSPYHLWVRYSSTATAPQDIRVDRVTSDPTQPNQTLGFLGVVRAPRTGNLNLFNYARLTDVQGNPVALPLSGTTTLRLTASSATDDLALNFFFLLPVGATPAAPSVTALPGAGATGVAPDATVTVAIFDGTSPVNQGTVKLRVNGAEVAAAVTKAGGVTSVKHTPSQVWASGATNALNLTCNDGTDRSFDWSFTTLAYPLLTPGMKATGISTPGFVWKVHQNEANQDANLQKADGILGGTLVLANLADPNALGPASAAGTPATPGNGMMTFRIPTVINLGQDTMANEGNFTPDEQMPGIPGTTAGVDGIVAEMTAFLDLPAGFINIGVNSDDGFRTTAGYLNDAPLLIGQVDGGRSPADTIIPLGVQEAGVYAFRTVYYEGGGGAAVEWFMVKSDGTKVLLNDTANGGARTYQNGTIPTKPIENVRITAGLNANDKVVLIWSTGTLQSADTVNGAFGDVGGATSPYEINPADAQQKFYRVRVQ